MKSDADIIIKRLTSHIRELISGYENLKFQNEAISKELALQKNKAETYKQKIEDLKSKLAELELKENEFKLRQEEQQLKNSFIEAGGGDIDKAKESIVRLIAEIDSCIYLLDE